VIARTDAHIEGSSVAARQFVRDASIAADVEYLAVRVGDGRVFVGGVEAGYPAVGVFGGGYVAWVD